MLYLLLALTVCELLVVTLPLWEARRPLAAGIGIAVALVSGSMLGIRFSWATFLVAILSLYRVINLLRIVKDRSSPQHLLPSVRRTTLWLASVQTLILCMLAVTDVTKPDAKNAWLVLSFVQLGCAIGVWLVTRRNLRTTIPPLVSEHFSDSQLPSLSVCIPARNETAALEACLHSLVGSTYPKLEIIVLDDCSQGSRTSDIIRGFAHDGVRFIEGKPTPDDWLAKNWAYEQLFEASSGDIVLFCGVDVQFDPSTLRVLVTALLAKNKRVMSVLPRNNLPQGIRNQLALLIQPARYAWELCLPRRRFNRPPVLSSCWLAERKLVDRSGAFAAVRQMITPEAYFAKKAITHDGYSFVRSTPELVLTSTKSYRDQWETAVRTRYPQLRKRIEMVFFVSLAELLLLITPFVLAITAAIEQQWLTAVWAGLAAMLICSVYASIVRMAYQQQLLKGVWLAPFAVLLNIYLRHESLWRYEFDEVTWKGRNVCIPVMHVIPRLPEL
jgi:hypothetical protein